jgi:alpha-2-macroglobulin
MIKKKTHTFRYLPFIIVIVSLACSLPGLFKRGGQPTATPGTSFVPTSAPAQPLPTPHPLPPAIVESDPPSGAELPLDGLVTFYFNQPMRRETVEAALNLQPALAGQFDWKDDATLVFEPSQSMAPESAITFTLSTEAEAANGLALMQPVSLEYRTVGYLSLSQALPEPGAYDVDPSSAILVTFNRPVVPLGAEPDSLPQAFSIDPLPQGRAEWLNTSTYAFYPDPSLEGGRGYTVRLNEELHSLDGSPLESQDEPLRPANEWSFITATPKAVALAPASDLGAIRLDATFVITFNQSMDPLSVESNLALLQEGKSPVQGKMTWDDKFTQVEFSPDSLLARDTAYTLQLSQQAQASSGTTIEAPVTQEYITVSNLAVTSSDPPQGGVKPYYQSVMLTLNAPVNEEDLKRNISIEPRVPNFQIYWSPYDRIMYVDGSYSPGENYTLRISPELTDIWGGTLGDEYVLNFSNASLPPAINFTYTADAIFLTGQDNALPAQVTNLSVLDLSLGSVQPQDFIPLVSGENAYDLRRSYIPVDQRSWQQPVDVPLNQTQNAQVYVSPEQEPLSPGLYHMRFNNLPQDVYAGPYLLVVSNAQVTLKLGATDVLVWAVGIDGKTPLGNTRVTVYDSKSQVLASGETDAQGIFYSSIAPLTDVYNTYYAVLSEPGQADFGMALSSWSQGIDPWNFQISADIRPPKLDGYLYTDRPIYRPGQTVYFRAVVRDAFNGRYSIPDMTSVPLALYYNYGEEIARFDLPVSAFGTIHGEYTLPEDAQLGYYRLSPPLDEIPYHFEVYFRVAEYRKPEIDAQVQVASDQLLAGDTLVANVSANYFFGAPAGNVPVQWTLTSNYVPFNLPGYQVGLDDLRWMDPASIFGSYSPFGALVEQGEARTDDQGKLVLELPVEQVEALQRYTLEVTLQDESGQPVSARDSAEVNPADIYIGVQPDAWVGRAGVESGFDIQVVDWEKQSAGERDLRADFQKVVWERQDPIDPFGAPKFVPTYTPVGSTDFRTNASGQARLAFTPPEPGTYQLDVTGGGARTTILLWVGGPGQAIWPNLPDQRIKLTADRQGYMPGDTARVFVPNPYSQETLALLAVERGVLMRYEVVNLPPGGDTLEIPLSSQEAPNVYVSTLLLGSTPEGRPDFRAGYLNLPVLPTEQTFNVQVTSQPQQTGPGDQVALSIQVTDASGAPVQGEFSLSMVDKALLALADPNSTSIDEAFYGEQILGIRTGVALAAYAWRQTRPPTGGGGGGGEEISPFVRQQFLDTAYWNAEIQTDAEGRASVNATLPDNLTTWQVLARGVTQDTRVGEGEIDLLTTKELLVRPVVPRFLVARDHVQLAAIVQNNTSGDLTVDVALQPNGVTLDDPASANRRVMLAAGGRQRLEWWGTVEDVESVDLLFSAASGELTDAVRPASGKLPVLRYNAPQTFRTSGILEEAGERLELVSLPRSFDPGSGELGVEMAPSLAAAMFSGLDVLENYPYACTEQTLSRFLPNLETYRVLQDFGVDAPDLKARLDRTLSPGLESLLASQNQDGSWGWWSGNDGDAYITAYMLFGLSRARQAGISVDEAVIQRAVDYLRGTLYTPNMTTESWQLDRLVFVQFALTSVGAGDLVGAEALFEVRSRLSPASDALLALTLETLSPGNQSTRTLFSDLKSTAIRSATGVHWEEESPGWQNMSTPVSVSAMVIYALAQHDPGSPLVADAVRYLMASRTADGAWDTTYGTAWTLMALSQVIKGTGELSGNFDFSATLNSQPIASGQASDQAGPVQTSLPVSQLFPDDPNALVLQRDAGNGRLYYTVGLQVSRPVEDAAPLQNGISIQRSYYPMNASCTGSDCDSIQGLPAGQVVQARLTFTLENAAYYLVVEDYLPAGAEILDTSLKTSQQVIPGMEEPAPEQPLYDTSQPFDQGWGWWFFSPPRNYDERIAWSADYLPAGTYELTYTINLIQPGEFRVLPARSWQFYFPEVQGNSAGAIFTIQP